MPGHPADRPASAASADRRPTGDPDRFLIPAERLPDGFYDALDGGVEPVAARPAATVLLLRAGAEEPEALLLRRHRRSGFAAGAWVFPGGTVDREDGDPGLGELLDGPTPEEWAARMGLEDAEEALGYVAAALREALEETGLLLARPVGAEDADALCVASPTLEAARRALLAGDTDLVSVALGEGVRLAGDRLLYLAHWITPEPEPRRYDTRFFLAEVPGDVECRVHEPELTEARWLRPADAVREYRAGELKLLPPTLRVLQRLAGFRSVEEVDAALRDAPVRSVTPTMRRVPEGVEIVVPEWA